MIYNINTISTLANKLHQDNKTIVLVTGFFDLLHSEHINFLRAAKKVGDILIVGVESDERARALKGEGRPVQPQPVRLQALTLHADYLLALDKDFNNPQAFESLIAAVKPTHLAVSSHTAHQDNKANLVEKYGGTLKIVHTHNPQVSTTNIINQL
ncbi:MAG: hypothetical protein DPW11_01560 [bacterium]|nr:hypothetical protein [Candidatus Microgenomates bacterium CPR3]MCQ3944445.1 hypothetical protein [bacterium]RIK52181.1 MAG: hypothetical protein DCC61_00130 [Candidatus Microgenomates bacterium]